MPRETVVIGSDHASYNLKEYVKDLLSRMRCTVLDVGPFIKESVDYPDYALKVALAVKGRRNTKGILSCGTGIGASIAANKVPGIRAALAHNARAARLSRQHNDANVLVLGGRPYNKSLVRKIVKTWLATPFEGGRHTRRLNKIRAIENKFQGASPGETDTF